jgi:hypothetical protein
MLLALSLCGSLLFEETNYDSGNRIYLCSLIKRVHKHEYILYKREQIALVGPFQHHLPMKLRRASFFDGMMYNCQLVQWYLIDRRNLLSLYKFQQRNELISFLISINLWSS